MDYTLTDTQEQMKRAAREFFAAEDVIGLAREQVAARSRPVEDLWDQLAEMGYAGCTVPTTFGGLGEGLLLATLLHEEAGRVAMPGPFPETVAFAAPLIEDLGTDDQRAEYLPAIADGDLRLSVGIHEGGGEPLPQGIQLTAEPVEGGYRLDGTKHYVPYGSSVDVVVVPARTRPGSGLDGISLFLIDPDDETVEPLDSLDRTRPLSRLTLADHRVPTDAKLGPAHDAGPALRRAMDRYTTAICGMMVGAADRIVDGSIDHARQREQFGHPIGRYQAVKHRVVDMWMAVEAGTSLVYYAAAALSSGRSDGPRAVSAAKSFCSERFIELCQDDVQNHGAMGFTWDHDTHIFLKQLTAWENFLGSPADHRERIADARRL